MKKMLLCFMVIAGSLSCDNYACGPCGLNGSGSKMTYLRAEICNENVIAEAGETIASANVRLKLFCEISTIEGVSYSKGGSSAKDCPVMDNVGLDPSLDAITLTCDRSIANIEAGEDIISVIRPRVRVKDRYNWSIEEWKTTLNDGVIYDPISFGSSSYSTTLSPNMTYEFDISFLPYFVTVEEGDYTFTVNLFFGENNDYSRTFSSVHLK